MQKRFGVEPLLKGWLFRLALLVGLGLFSSGTSHAASATKATSRITKASKASTRPATSPSPQRPQAPKARAQAAPKQRPQTSNKAVPHGLDIPKRAAPRSTKAPNRATPRSTKASKEWFHISYLLDWGLALGIGAGSAVAFELIAPVERDFSPGDSTLSLPIKATLFSWPITLAISAGVPLLGIGLAQIGVRSWHDFHHAALGLTESLSLTLLMVGALQVTVGRLRPDFRDRCIPNVSDLTCTGNAQVILDGRRSFPSKQTALAFAGGTFLTLYLAGKLGWLRDDAFWKVPVILAPMLGATFLGVAQVVNNRNHWEDVLIGGLLGAAAAFISYHLHFSDLFGTPQAPGQPRNRNAIKGLAIAPVLHPEQIGLAISGRW